MRRWCACPAGWRSLAVAGGLALALTGWRFGGALELWWCCDDPQILRHALRFAPWQYFLVPEAWQALIPYSLTPWLSLSYDLDWALWGGDPRGYYAHALLSIALCALMVFVLARQWCGPLAAGAGMVLFLAGAPVAVAAQQLMVRHYVEGLLFLLVMLWAVVRGVRRLQAGDGGHAGYGALAGVAMALAASAKEVYLPLGLLWLVLPIGQLRQRLRVGWPVLLAIGLYVPWRAWMLGSLIGGYTPGESLEWMARMQAAWAAFAGMAGELWAQPRWAVGALVLLGVLATLRPAQAGRRAAWLAVLAVLPVLLFVPLLPLVGVPGLSLRYFIAAWGVLAVASALLVQQASGARPGLGGLLALGCVAVVTVSSWQAGGQAWQAGAQYAAAHRAQGEVLLHGDARSVVLAAPEVSYWFNEGMLALRAWMGAQGPAPRLAADESGLVGLEEVEQVLRLDRSTMRMQAAPFDAYASLQPWRARLSDVPLQVWMRHDGHSQVLEWRFDTGRPADDGSHGAAAGQFFYLPANGAFPLPARGALRMLAPPPGCFRIRLEMPDGQLAYSTLLHMPEPVEGVSLLDWHGAAEAFASPAGLQPCPR